MPTRFLLVLAGASLLVLVILAPAHHLSQSQAEAAALAAVPGGVLQHSELDSTQHEPIWKLSVARPGKVGAMLVLINARTQQLTKRPLSVGQ